MRPPRPEQTNYAAGLAILSAAFVLLLLLTLVSVPLLQKRGGVAVQRMGTPIVALATARAASRATATGTPPATATPLPLDTATPAPLPTDTPPPASTATPVPADTATVPPAPLPTDTPPAPPPPATATAYTPPPASTATETASPTALPMPTPSPLPLAALTDPQFLASLSREVIVLTNRQRVAHGLVPLTPDQGLTQIAVERSEDMIRRDYFNHFDPATHQPAVVELLNQADIPYHEVGENIVDNRNEPLDTSTPAQVVAAWMSSREHRANILYPAYTNIGVGIAVAQQDGSLRVVFTQVFLD